jgi:hypothetical protein
VHPFPLNATVIEGSPSNRLMSFTGIVMVAPNQKDRIIASGITLIIIGLCGLTSGSHVYVTDGAAMYFMTASLVDHHWFDVDLHPNTMGGKIGKDGLYYMPFGFLQPLLAVPFLLMGRWLKSLYHTCYLPFFAVTAFNWVVSGILGSTVYYSFRTFCVSRRMSVLLGLGILFSTPFWVYSQTFFTEPLAALMGLLAWLSLRKGHAGKSAFPILCAGMIAGMITWVRPLGGLIIPPLVLYFLLLEKNRPGQDCRSSHLIKKGIAFVVPATLGVLVYLYYNFVRFGNILETGYDKLPSGMPRSFTLDFQTGLGILLLSPGKSIFVFAPVILIVPIGIIMGFRQISFRPDSIFQMFTGLLYVSVLSRWARVEGGVAWGPRLILPAFPILFLALAPLLNPQKKRLRYGVMCLLTAGFLVQIPGVLVNFSTYIARNADEYYSPVDGSYVFRFNPFPGHLRELREHLSVMRDLQPKPAHLTERHREQVNPDGVLDVWWLQMWLDGVPTGFINRLTMLLLGLTCSGLLLVGYGLKQTRFDT